ncbi:MAG: methylmalonyl-CoA mutase family protein [Thermoanaerobaculia bacterium]
MNKKNFENFKKNYSKEKERKEVFYTPSRRKVKEIYTPFDLKDFDYEREVGYPGEFPFTRGVYPTMYRGRLWTMRQYAGFSTPEESNKRYKYLLEKGQTGLSVAFDLPTQIGYDSDSPLAKGEVGKVGVAIDSLQDMEILFDGIPLKDVSVSMTINATAPIILAMYIAVAKKQKVDLKDLRGTVQNDILKEYIARGTYIFPPEPSLKLCIDIIEFCKENIPKFNPISISGYHIREAGSTASQELAFTFANALEYIDSALKRGLKIDEFAPKLSFFFNCHNNFLEEVAKFRAARKIWAKIMKENYKAKNKDSMLLRFHTQTAGSTLTAQQPENNIIRVCIQAMAAVSGGTQSLHTNSYDEALCLPTEGAVKIALRTQQIIAYESGLADTIDPFAGSYLIEKWTMEIEEEVFKYLNKIKNLGGALKGILSGFQQNQIHNSAYEYQKEIEKKERIIVGVNSFEEKESKEIPVLKVPPEVEKKQREKLKIIKNKRDEKIVNKKLKQLKDFAKRDKNLIYPILEAVESYATLGEITDALKEVFGEYRDINIF